MKQCHFKANFLPLQNPAQALAADVASTIECSSSLCSVTVDTSCCPPPLMLLRAPVSWLSLQVLSIRKVELEFFVFIRCEQKHVK